MTDDHLEKSLRDLNWLVNLNKPENSQQPVEDSNLKIKSTPRSKKNNDPGQFSNGFRKPSHSYAELISMAIDSSSRKLLTLSDIYLWIEENEGYFNKNSQNN